MSKHDELIAVLKSSIDGYVRRAVQPVADMVKEIRERLDSLPKPERGEKGEKGERGESVDHALVVKEVLALVPVPKDGKDGAKGADGLNGKDGAPGKDGARGADGLNGKDGESIKGDRGEKGEKGDKGDRGDTGPAGEPPSIEVLQSLIGGEVARQIAALPAAKDGRDGRDGEDGRDGIDGKDGRDGIRIDGIAGEFDGRMLTMTLTQAGREFKMQAPIPGLPQYVGIWKSGQHCEHGDMVTYGGSVWMAKSDTDKPPPGDDWQMVVKGTR